MLPCFGYGLTLSSSMGFRRMIYNCFSSSIISAVVGITSTPSTTILLSHMSSADLAEAFDFRRRQLNIPSTAVNVPRRAADRYGTWHFLQAGTREEDDAASLSVVFHGVGFGLSGIHAFRFLPIFSVCLCLYSYGRPPPFFLC